MWDNKVPYRDRYAHMMAKKGLWMTNLFKNRFVLNVTQNMGDVTGKIESILHTIVKFPGTKNMHMK